MNNKQRLKNVLNIYSGGTPQENDIYLTENEISISWLTPSDFSTGSDILKSSRFIKNGCQKSILLPKNSLIMSCRAPVGKIGYIKNNGMAFNQGCKGFIPKKNQNSKYWFFVLLSLKNEFDKFSKGTTFKEINTKNVKNIIVRKETIQNQNLIANFLEKISSNINLNIEKKSKKIELLKEYKESLIYETVTKGLDKNVEMKDSGIDWIGTIPVKWSTKRIKYFYKLGMGQTILKEDVLDEGLYPILSATEKEVVFGYLNKLNIVLRKNDMVIPARGNSIGFVKILNQDSGCTQTTIYMKKQKTKLILSKYVYYYLTGHRKSIFNYNHTAIPQITVDDIKNKKVLCPPLIEQSEIIDFLDKKTKEIDSEVEILSKKVKLIEELKESIIYECVTGKLDIEVDGEKYQKIIESI